MSEHLAITARQEPSSGYCLSGHASFLLCEREALASPPMNWRGWQPLCLAPLLHGLTAPCRLQGSVATYSLQSVVHQGLGVGVWAGEWLMLHINPASVHTSLSLHPEARDSLLLFFLPVSILTTHLWKLMSHLNGEDDEVKRHGNTALIHILNIIKTHMEMHLRKHAVSISFPNETTASLDFWRPEIKSPFRWHSCSRLCSVAQSCLTLCAHRDCSLPLPMGFPRQEFWSRGLLPPPGDLPNPGIQSVSSVLAGRFFTMRPPVKPI